MVMSRSPVAISKVSPAVTGFAASVPTIQQFPPVDASQSVMWE